MPNRSFRRDVSVTLPGLGEDRVSSVRAAAQVLLDVRWPRRGRRYRSAADACLAVLGDRRPALDPEQAFIDAARSAGVLVEKR